MRQKSSVNAVSPIIHVHDAEWRFHFYTDLLETIFGNELVHYMVIAWPWSNINGMTINQMERQETDLT